MPHLQSSVDPSHRPRLLRDVVLLPVEEGVIVDGLARQEIIRGPIAQTVLPLLLELMDGTRTIDDLSAAFPEVPAGYVTTAVSLLEEWGLLERANDGAAAAGAEPEAAAFLRRRIASAHLADCPSRAIGKLAGAAVVVAAAGSGPHAELLRSLLVASGFGTVRVSDLASPDAEPISQGTVVVGLSASGDECRFFSELQRRAKADGFSWLRAALNERAGWADIGPIFRPGNATCYSCCHAMHGADDGSPTPAPDVESYWLGQVALELIYLAALPDLAVSGRDFRRLSLPNWQRRALSYARRPGCTDCWTVLADPTAVDTAVVFEQYVGLETRRTLIAGVPASDGAPPETKLFPNCEQIPLGSQSFRLNLPALDALRAPLQPGSRKKVKLDQLAGLLALTGGVRERSARKIQRWAATAGNLGSVELFVAARSVEGLAPGIYFYTAETHSLAAFRKRNGLDAEQFIRRALGCDERDLPAALVVLTGAFHRLERKYAAFGHRLVNLDAGCALAQSNLAAQALKLCSRTAPAWADEVIERELNLRGPGEQVTAVVELAPARTRCNRNVGACARKAPREFQGLTAREVGEILFGESRLPESAVKEAVADAARRALPIGERAALRLPAALRGHLSVGEVLASRRSVRSFGPKEAPLVALATMLQLAHSGDAADWPDERDQPLQILLLARRASRLQPGVYRYDGASHGLAHLRPAISAEDWNTLFVQDDWAEAAFAIWIAGDLRAACARHGPWGHRQLLLRAGAACQRMWMAGLALGLSGAPVAGLVPGAARALLGLDGYERASLLALVGGFESET